MKKSELKAIIIMVLSILLLLFNSFINKIFDRYSICLFVIVLFIVLFILFGFIKSKNRFFKDVVLNILADIIIYYIVSYLLGLVLKFTYSIYSFTFVNLIKNIVPVLIVIIFSELSRYIINQKFKSNKYVLALSLFLFFMIDTTLVYERIDFSSFNTSFNIISLLILPSFSINFLLTYLSTVVDYRVCILYRILMEIPVYILPFFTDFGVYIESIIKFVFPIIVFWRVYVSFMKLPINSILKKQTKKNSFVYVIILVISFFIVLLTSGSFKYRLYVVATGSMIPNINKGDVVITKKLSDEEKNKLDVGRVIVFKQKGKIIVHRIFRTVASGKQIFFETKGDNNNSSDGYLIDISNIIGIADFRIPYIGYPTVLLNEKLNAS